jgi:hypothetical protein
MCQLLPHPPSIVTGAQFNIATPPLMHMPAQSSTLAITETITMASPLRCLRRTCRLMGFSEINLRIPSVSQPNIFRLTCSSHSRGNLLCHKCLQLSQHLYLWSRRHIQLHPTCYKFRRLPLLLRRKLTITVPHTCRVIGGRHLCLQQRRM